MEKESKENILLVTINNYNKVVYFRRKAKMCLRYALILHNRIKRRILNMHYKRIKSKYRRFWTCVEASNFWEVEVPKLDEESFKNKFRVNRVTFDFLVKSLKHLARKDTFWRLAIPLEKRLGIALYTLGSSSEYRSIAGLFGVGRTTVGQILINVCNAICTCLIKVAYDSYPPDENAFDLIKARFRKVGKGMEANMKNIDVIVKAVCILHNICNNNNDHINNNWMEEYCLENPLQKSQRCPSHENNNGIEISNDLLKTEPADDDSFLAEPADDAGNAGELLDLNWPKIEWTAL